MRIGFFGTFYPQTQKAANSSTGIGILLARSTRVERLELFIPTSARLPTTLDQSRVQLHALWSLDGPASLLRATVALLRRAPQLDGYLFNIHMTSFGRSSLVNGIGLLVPTIVAKFTRKPVLVYMHNLYSSQEVSKLGYTPNFLVRHLARLLERNLLVTTDLVVPLASMAESVKKAYGRTVPAILIPYVEAVHSTVLSTQSPPAVPKMHSPFRILLFGHWGPQKDITGIFQILRGILSRVPDVTITVAGEMNLNFPAYASSADREIRANVGERLRFIGRVDEDQLGELFLSHDVLLLPYTSTGGYSGAINAAAPSGLRIIAYDLPQLHETAGIIGAQVSFVGLNSECEIESELRALLARSVAAERVTVDPQTVLRRASLAVDQLLNRLAENAARLGRGSSTIGTAFSEVPSTGSPVAVEASLPDGNSTASRPE
jgi:glycosyltransferase involved in cell wall biosynthesis